MSAYELDNKFTRLRASIGRQAQRRIFILMLVGGDAVALALAFIAAYGVRFYFDLPVFDDTGLPQIRQLESALLLIPLCLIVYALFQLYDWQYLLGGTQEYARIFNATTVIVTIIIVSSFAFPVVRISRGWIALCWLFGITAALLTRWLQRRIVYRLRRYGILTRRTLIVGADAEAIAIAEQLRGIPTCGAEIIGFVADAQPPGTVLTENLVVLGPLDHLPALVTSLDAQEIIVSTTALTRQQIINIFQDYAFSENIDVRLSSGLFEIFTTGVHIREIASVPLVSMNKVRLDPWESAIKTAMDYLVAAGMLIVLAPVMLAIALLVKRDSPGPILHRRRVVGRGGRVFDAFKFRSMYVNGHEILAAHPEMQAELQDAHKLKQDPRITPLGRILRRTSLDELPQLFNVLRGQMSLVGPRMITLEETQKYGKWRLNLLTVKPGITGLWQISGRSDVSYDQRVRLDMYYIRNYSIWLDLMILWRTIPAVLRGRGAY
jgi:exopolysaccharide biosynthesis polyprenyl glycosylphosphotransferase